MYTLEESKKQDSEYGFRRNPVPSIVNTDGLLVCSFPRILKNKDIFNLSLKW